MPAVPRTRTTAAANRDRASTATGTNADHQARLAELRDRLTAEIAAGPPASALASLGRELRSTIVELAANRTADTADARQRLEALTGVIRAAMDDPGTSAAAVAALGRELRALLAELAALAADEPDPDGIIEQLRARREARLAAARAAHQANEGTAS